MLPLLWRNAENKYKKIAKTHKRLKMKKRTTEKQATNGQTDIKHKMGKYLAQCHSGEDRR